MKKILCTLLFVVGAVSHAGIPEPGLTLYGTVRQNLGGAHARLTTGTMNITINPEFGTPLTLSTTLTNLNNQFSFVLYVPFESSVVDFPVSTNALELTVSPSEFTRTPITINGTAASLLPPASTTIAFGQANRGTFDRMDLAVTLPILDSDGDGLPNEWENLHFGHPTNQAGPNGDPDGDGFTNLQEYLAGTDPNEPDSVLFVTIENLPGNTNRITWVGAPNRFYRVLRSTQISTGYAPIATGLVTTSPENVYLDVVSPTAPTFFYRIEVE